LDSIKFNIIEELNEDYLRSIQLQRIWFKIMSISEKINKSSLGWESIN